MSILRPNRASMAKALSGEQEPIVIYHNVYEREAEDLMRMEAYYREHLKPVEAQGQFVGFHVVGGQLVGKYA